MQEALALHRLTYVPERDGVTVGRPDTETYAVLPEDGARLLQVLAEGTPVPAAAEWYQSTYGESVDMDDFVAAITELGFVRCPDEEGEEATPPPIRQQALGRALFSPFAWACYALVVAGAVVVTVRSPELRPRPASVFFTSYLIAVQLVVMIFGMMAGTLLHEWFHLMAGYRRGLPGKISARVAFVPLGVFETEVAGLLGLPRRQRYLPFAAGMIADLVLCSGLTLAAAALRSGPHWVWQLFLAIAYVNLIRLAFQLLLFMRSDPYHVLITALGCGNLTGPARAYLRQRTGPARAYLRQKAGRKQSSRPRAGEEDWAPRDRVLAPWFVLLNVAGVAVLATILAFGMIPVAVTFYVRLTGGLIHHPVTSPHFWDSVAVVGVLIVDTAIGSVIVKLAKRLLRTGARTAVSPAIPSPDGGPQRTG